MIKSIKKGIFPLAALVLCGCSWFETRTYQVVVQPMIKNPTSVVVCRDRQCAPARLSMSREYIYNSLLQLMQNNKGSKALVCAADAASHVCTENYITMPIKVGITPAYMYIDDVKITDVTVTKGQPKIELVLNYNVTYNGQSPECRPARSLMFVESANSIMLEDSGYSCKMTAVGMSYIRSMFAIDYIDLDYGYIGGYYSVGLSGPANGGGAGYMMFRLQTNAYPLSPALMALPPEEPEKTEEPAAPKEPEKTEEPATPKEPEIKEINARQKSLPSNTPTQKVGTKTTVITRNEPATQKEIMVDNKTDITLQNKQPRRSRALTRVIVEKGTLNTSSTPAKVQIFPIYNKKPAAEQVAPKADSKAAEDKK